MQLNFDIGVAHGQLDMLAKNANFRESDGVRETVTGDGQGKSK